MHACDIDIVPFHFHPDKPGDELKASHEISFPKGNGDC